MFLVLILAFLSSYVLLAKVYILSFIDRCFCEISKSKNDLEKRYSVSHLISSIKVYSNPMDSFVGNSNPLLYPSMYACMYVCMLCMFVCMYVRMHVCMYVYVCMHV